MYFTSLKQQPSIFLGNSVPNRTEVSLKVQVEHSLGLEVQNGFIRGHKRGKEKLLSTAE